MGKKYDAYNIQLKNENGQPIQAKGSCTGSITNFWYSPGILIVSIQKRLEITRFTIRDGMLEFLTIDLTTYAIVYKTETEVQQPSSTQAEEASPLANKKPAQW